ncbi:MAG TPA: PH domain-containing protein, partial [Pyrinomonadaceae bacterium]|nr:PH domain-containing protein [Pyrinomonadaceae bacterium]
AIPLGLALFLIPAFYHFKQKMIRYTLTDAKIEIDEGLIFQNSRNVPLRSIQDVSVASTITQRMLGFGDLVIDNASEDNSKVVFKNINSPKKYADAVLKQMRLLDK